MAFASYGCLLFQSGMNVRKEESPIEPAYPDAREFLKNRAALGAALLGAGMALGGCEPTPRLGGVPMPNGSSKDIMIDRNRLDGVAVCEPKSAPPRVHGNLKSEGPLIPGIPLEGLSKPTSDPPRLPGKPKIEPPVLPGVPPMVPPNPEP